HARRTWRERSPSPRAPTRASARCSSTCLWRRRAAIRAGASTPACSANRVLRPRRFARWRPGRAPRAEAPSSLAGRPGRMLTELRVENLLLIERAELRLGPGLVAITGETGAGKTVLAHALDLLLGGKPRPGIVRPGAREAYVEGVFELPAGALEGDALADLRERLEEPPPDEIVL